MGNLPSCWSKQTIIVFIPFCYPEPKFISDEMLGLVIAGVVVGILVLGAGACMMGLWSRSRPCRRLSTKPAPVQSGPKSAGHKDLKPSPEPRSPDHTSGLQGSSSQRSFQVLSSIVTVVYRLAHSTMSRQRACVKTDCALKRTFHIVKIDLFIASQCAVIRTVR